MPYLPVLLAAAILSAGCAMSPAASGNASVSGAIRIGNQPAPALRVCAMPVAGGDSRCVETAAGADRYRIDGLAAGRYHLVGWVRGGELRLLAHATTIRCIRAPCPPDELIEVELASGASVADADLTAPYTEIPAGWPREPAG